MADYRQQATARWSAVAAWIASLIRQTEVSAASMVQAAACRRPNGQFLLSALSVLFLKGEFCLRRLRPCRPSKLRQR